MESEEVIETDSDACYPVLIIPKSCSTLETNCEATDNVYIKLNITSLDTQGKESTIYSGFCNVKIIESYDVDQEIIKIDSNLSDSDNVQGEITLTDCNDLYYSENQAEMLMDPMNNPYVSNDYSAKEAEESYCVYETHREHIARQHSPYIKQNVYDAIRYSPRRDFELKKFGQVTMNDEINQQPVDLSLDEELECGVFLSQLPEEIMLASESKAREEMKYVNLVSDNNAIQQLMSSDLQSRPRQQRTILFIGDSSHDGHTVQKITLNDPKVECAEVGGESDLVDGNPRQKKYQCNKCQQVFCQIAAFRQHIQIKHFPAKPARHRASGWPVASDLGFMCSECGKHFKTREKFEMHCLGHGNPELECQKCHKVFASKLSLKNHAKIHLRKQKCSYCRKSYQKSKELREHLRKMHFIYQCDRCSFFSSERRVLLEHERGHGSEVPASDSEATASLDGWREAAAVAEEVPVAYEQTARVPDGQDPDAVIAKVMSNKMFLLNSKKANKMKKICNICLKNFSRVSDLKRHLIEHVIRSTLAKNPVDDSGTLFMQCEVCQAQTFRRVDRYKAHLREHAKLTIYQCTFCDKSFSDSSNFSKHKKIHGTMFFQCDLCHRKFHSKKTIIKHLQHHIKMEPLRCNYCDKDFYFPSILRRHMKLVHTRDMPRVKCKFCAEYFKSLKEKWDHEWSVHNVRKMIVDCLVCGSKFRKYSELKQHCKTFHEIAIPPIKKLLQKRRNRK